MPLRLKVVAKPGRKFPSLTTRDGTVIVCVRERAIEGRANAAIERAIAAWLGCDVRSVAIVSGTAGRTKFVEVHGVDPAVVARKLAGET